MIETTQVGSVASLRASFDARSSKPVMPMNSKDPRVRHSILSKRASTPVKRSWQTTSSKTSTTPDWKTSQSKSLAHLQDSQVEEQPKAATAVEPAHNEETSTVQRPKNEGASWKNRNLETTEGTEAETEANNEQHEANTASATATARTGVVAAWQNRKQPQTNTWMNRLQHQQEQSKEASSSKPWQQDKTRAKSLSASWQQQRRAILQKQEEDEQPREETSPLPPTFSNTSPAIRSISVANKLTKWEYQKKREVEEYLEEKKSSELPFDEDAILSAASNDISDATAVSRLASMTDDSPLPQDLPRELKQARERSPEQAFQDQEVQEPLGHDLVLAQSDDVSLYIEDNQKQSTGEQRSQKQPQEQVQSYLNKKSDYPHPQEVRMQLETLKIGDSNNGNEPPLSNKYPKLVPSPRDNDAYRIGYFGDESAMSVRCKERQKTSPNNSPSCLDATVVGKDDHAKFELQNHDNHATVLQTNSSISNVDSNISRGASSDKWLDSDTGFHDDTSRKTSGGDRQWMRKHRKSEAWPPSRSKGVTGFANHGVQDKFASAPSSNGTWATTPRGCHQQQRQRSVAGYSKKKQKIPKTSDAFDPFADSNDTKICNSENLFSPSPLSDPFLTEESFSPPDWGTPRMAPHLLSNQNNYMDSPDWHGEI